MRRGEQPREKRYTKTRAKAPRKDFDYGRSNKKHSDRNTEKDGVHKAPVSQFTRAVREFGQRRQSFDSKSSEMDNNVSAITKRRLTVQAKRGLFMHSKLSAVMTRASPLNALNEARKEDNLHKIIRLANSEPDNLDNDRTRYEPQADHRYQQHQYQQRSVSRHSSIDNLFNNDIGDKPCSPQLPLKQQRKREMQRVSNHDSETDLNYSAKFSPFTTSTVKSHIPGTKRSRSSARKSRRMQAMAQYKPVEQTHYEFLSPIDASGENRPVLIHSMEKAEESRSNVMDLSSVNDNVECDDSYESFVAAMRDSIVTYYQAHLAKEPNECPLQVAKKKLQFLYNKTCKALDLKREIEAQQNPPPKATITPVIPLHPSKIANEAVFLIPHSPLNPPPTRSAINIEHCYASTSRESARTQPTLLNKIPSSSYHESEPANKRVHEDNENDFNMSNFEYVSMDMSPLEELKMNLSYSPVVPEEPVISDPIQYLTENLILPTQHHYKTGEYSTEHNFTVSQSTFFDDPFPNFAPNYQHHLQPDGHRDQEDKPVQSYLESQGTVRESYYPNVSHFGRGSQETGQHFYADEEMGRIGTERMATGSQCTGFDNDHAFSGLANECQNTLPKYNNLPEYPYRDERNLNSIEQILRPGNRNEVNKVPRNNGPGNRNEVNTVPRDNAPGNRNKLNIAPRNNGPGNRNKGKRVSINIDPENRNDMSRAGSSLKTAANRSGNHQQEAELKTQPGTTGEDFEDKEDRQMASAKRNQEHLQQVILKPPPRQFYTRRMF